MKSETLKAIKPLTNPMIELLKNCYITEINTVSHIKLYDQSAVKGLIERGLLEQRSFLKKGEQEIIYLVTETGKLYLKHYFSM